MTFTRPGHVVVLATWLSLASSSLAVTYYEIYPGQQAVISFHFNGSPILNNTVPDLLALLIGGNTPFGLTPATYSLFDGDTLLGSVRPPGDSDSGRAFRSFDNPFPGYLYGPSVPVNFTSIRNGTIEGRLFYAPEFVNPAPGEHATLEFELYLLKQTGFNSGVLTQDPTVDSIQIIPIPEPTAPVLFSLGLVAILLRSRRGDIQRT